MKRKFIALSALLMLMLSGCFDKSTDVSTSSTDNVESSVEETISETVSETKAPETPEEFHEAMLNRSILSTGNNSRLKSKLDKLRNGEKTVIGYIGGSITQGVGANPETCWAKQSFNGIAELYGTGDNAEYINAGISGTPSILGNLRFERDILSKNADIIFIEFAVNDGNETLYKESFESMVHAALSHENAPAVVLMINRTENGHSCQEYMAQVGERYQLPMISVNDAITCEMDEGRMTWQDYSNDQSHPNEYGHGLDAEMVMKLFSVIDGEEADEPCEIPEIPVFAVPYRNAVLVTPDNGEGDENLTITDMGGFTPVNAAVYGFESSYMHDASLNGDMKISLKGANSFWVVYKRNNSDSMGSIDVYLNGNKLKTINSNDKDGWGDPYSAQVIKFSNLTDMDIEIKVSEGSEDKEIMILGFGYTKNEAQTLM